MGSCQSCGASLASDTRFCQACGAPTGPTAVPVPAAENSGSPVAFPSPANTGSKAMDTNVVGALAYLVGFITGIIFLVLDPYKSNSFVRFHAFQSIFFNIAWVGLWIVWTIVSIILSTITRGLFGLISLPVSLFFSLAGFAIWIFLMYQAYQQKLFKLPLVGKFAAQNAGVRP
jgi:uncharacterized membrane protein